jgi:hypothetical protein
MTYNAIVTRIKTQPHPKADRLKIGVCHGFQVVVGLDTQDGELGVFFPTDGILEHEFCETNNLYRIEDARGNHIGGGFFERDKPRVRAQGFRGEKSFGFFAPLSMFAYTGHDLSQLNEGFVFTELNGHKVCRKYESQATVRERTKRQQYNTRRETPMFPRHFETEQWRFFRNTLEPGDSVAITVKAHGTSERFGLVQEDVSLSWWQRIVNRFVPLQTKRWVRIVGSRNVILTDAQGGYYGDESFRFNAIDGIDLHKGEVIYGEIVGYVNENRLIMPAVSTASIRDRAFQKRYGDTIRYTYGCKPGECNLYVYRIVQMNEDGDALELSWQQVKARCRQLGIKHVCELRSYTYDGDLDALESYLETVVDGDDPIDPTHIREGVCIRIDRGLDTRIYKHKSFNFLVLEGVAKDKGEVDLEEAS